MFAYLKGILEHIDDNYIIIDVHGIGYKIYTSASTIERLSQLHQEIKVHTYLYIREDIIDLYGFLTKEELSMFELLISVSGIGPKAALAVLSTISPSKFALAVVTSDVKTITQIPGIGKKTAQRIMLELKDKIKSEEFIEEQINAPVDSMEDCSSEAVNALVVLGYSLAEATAAVKAVSSESNEVEEVIKKALKQLMKR